MARSAPFMIVYEGPDGGVLIYGWGENQRICDEFLAVVQRRGEILNPRVVYLKSTADIQCLRSLHSSGPFRDQQ